MTIKIELSKEQANFLARMLKSFTDTTDPVKFDPSVRPVRHDALNCLRKLKAAGASDQ